MWKISGLINIYGIILLTRTAAAVRSHFEVRGRSLLPPQPSQGSWHSPGSRSVQQQPRPPVQITSSQPIDWRWQQPVQQQQQQQQQHLRQQPPPQQPPPQQPPPQQQLQQFTPYQSQSQYYPLQGPPFQFYRQLNNLQQGPSQVPARHHFYTDSVQIHHNYRVPGEESSTPKPTEDDSQQGSILSGIGEFMGAAAMSMMSTAVRIRENGGLRTLNDIDREIGEPQKHRTFGLYGRGR